MPTVPLDLPLDLANEAVKAIQARLRHMGYPTKEGKMCEVLLKAIEEAIQRSKETNGRA